MGIGRVLPHPTATRLRPGVKSRPTESTHQHPNAPGTPVIRDSPRPELGPKLRKDKT